MFGLIVAGQLVQTNFEQVGETQFVTNIENIDNIKHIVVFLTGSTPFPNEFGGSVYFSLPSSSGTWHLLGHISNQKPSAIFKITGLKSCTPSSNSINAFGQPSVNAFAQVGIAVEPLSQLAGLTPANNVEASTIDSFLEFSTCMCENLYNYASSFAVPPTQVSSTSHYDQYIPISVLSKWYENFKRKLEFNPSFWKK